MRNLARLQDLANTVAPAHERHQFERRGKVVCTIGPNVANEKSIAMLMESGANVMRFNFSHGEYSWFEDVIRIIRKVKADKGRADVAIALDTKGPEIRTGQLAEGTPAGDPGFLLDVAQGETFLFSSDPALSTSSGPGQIYMDYADIGSTLREGDTMMVDDGLLEFEVTDTGDGFVNAVALNSGPLGERKGINLPGACLTLPAVSEKDKADLAFGAEQGVDLIFASFVRKGEHVAELRDALGEKGKGIGIISKIENLEGVQNFDEILEQSDGIMVARGDLGIEIPAPKVFVCQKLLIQKCNLAGKPVICATQMLESMVKNPRPTRAEVSDVANAIMDGADAVMLSGETAKGDWPKEAVETMTGIVREAEAVVDEEILEERQAAMMPEGASSLEAICRGVARASADQGASLLLLVTETGEATRLAAKYRPSIPIVACCPNEAVARQCALQRGVIPIVVPWRGGEPGEPESNQFASISVKKVIAAALAKVKKMGIVEGGKALVLHDSDISDGDEMSDWVLRLVDVESEHLAAGWG